MEAAEQVRQPELRILRLRLQLLEAAQRDANLVQQRGAVDLLLEVGGIRFLQGGRKRLERGEMGRERGGAEAAVAVVVARDSRLRCGDGIHVPVEVEKRLLDVAEAHAFNNRWHSSSDSTRSVRLAASNSVRQASSSLGS